MGLFKKKDSASSSDKDMKKLITSVINKEWEQKSKVKLSAAREGYALSKADYDIDRRGLLQLFSVEMLESMLRDLENDPDIMRHRKIYTFADTDPEQYEALKSELPKLPKERLDAIEDILETERGWAEYTQIQAPDSMRRELPFKLEDAKRFGEVSYFTSRRAELSTYGPETFQMFADLEKEYKDSGKNLVYDMYDNKAKLQGFVDLWTKESHIRKALATPCC